MMEDWSSINFIRSLNFTTVNNKDLNKKPTMRIFDTNKKQE